MIKYLPADQEETNSRTEERKQKTAAGEPAQNREYHYEMLLERQENRGNEGKRTEEARRLLPSFTWQSARLLPSAFLPPTDGAPAVRLSFRQGMAKSGSHHGMRGGRG